VVAPYASRAKRFDVFVVSLLSQATSDAREAPSPDQTRGLGTLRPQGDAEFSAPGLPSLFANFPAWLGGMTQEEAGLAVSLIARA